MASAKIKLDSDLLKKASAHAEEAGYANVEEFVTHLIEKALAEGPGGDPDEDSEEEVKEKLKGLGYIS